MVLFHYCSLGGNTAIPGGLHARLCHTFLVLCVFLINNWVSNVGFMTLLFSGAVWVTVWHRHQLPGLLCDLLQLQVTYFVTYWPTDLLNHWPLYPPTNESEESVNLPVMNASNFQERHLRISTYFNIFIIMHMYECMIMYELHTYMISTSTEPCTNVHPLFSHLMD